MEASEFEIAVDFNDESFELLKRINKNKLIFLHRENNSWFFVGSRIDTKIDNRYNFSTDYSLFIIDSIYPTEINPIERTYIKIHSINSKSEYDLQILFAHTQQRINEQNDKYWMLEFLWFLNWKDIDINVFSNIFNRIGIIKSQYFLDQIKPIIQCLSVNKQKAFEHIFQKYGIEYSIKYPNLLKDALSIQNKDIELKDKNLFDLVDEVCTYNEQSDDDNLWICFCNWINNEQPFQNYDKLKVIIPFVSESLRIEMIKRYFHDIRLKNTTFSENVIQEFKKSSYEEYIIYRKCINNPCGNIDSTLPLLADCILTIKRTDGNEFQSFNGILDLLVQNSDITNPNSIFNLEKIFPKCDKSAVIRYLFKGFIDFDVIYQLDENKLTETNLRQSVEKILDICNAQCECKNVKQIKCIYQNDSNTINAINVSKCKECKCNNLSNKWFLIDEPEYVEYVNCFLHTDIMIPKRHDNRKIIPIHDSAFWTDNLKKYIKNNTISTYDIDDTDDIDDNINKSVNNNNSQFVMSSSKYSNTNNFITALIKQYSTPISIRIKPNKDIICGLDFDVFGIKQTIQNENPNVEQDELTRQFYKEESERILSLVVNSLNNESNLKKNGDYYYCDYNQSILSNIISKYYYKYIYKEQQNDNQLLTDNANDYLCVPSLENERFDILNLPVFGCNGRQCFHNNLQSQLLKNCNSWKNYSLFHISEIIGFPMVKNIDYTYYALNPIISLKIQLFQVTKRYKRIRCNECGHLLFAVGVGRNGRSLYFQCINSTCQQRYNRIYIHNCYQCKHDIDSRETNQCSNGLYICPACLSCCSNDLFECQERRYKQQQLQVPIRIQNRIGTGHREANLYFCSKCGRPMENINNTHKCNSCKITFVPTEENGRRIYKISSIQ